jgi:hypothetical protein
MTNRNSFSSSQARRQDPSYSDPNDTLQDEVNARPATEDELAYREGYVQGRNEERFEQVEDLQQSREAKSVGAGAIIGVLMATVAGLVLAMLYLTPRQQTGVVPAGAPVAPAAVPVSPVPPGQVPAAPITPAQPQVGTAQPSSPVPNQVTVIERTQEVPAVQSPVQPPAQLPVQPQIQPPVGQPQLTQPVLTQPPLAQPSVAQPNATTSSDGLQIPAPTGPTDPYQSPQPNVITAPGTVGQP